MPVAVFSRQSETGMPTIPASSAPDWPSRSWSSQARPCTRPVGVGVMVAVGVMEGVGVIVSVGVRDGVGVWVAVGVGDGVGVSEAVGVGVMVGMSVAVGVRDGVGVSEAVGVAVGVPGVGVIRSNGAPKTSLPKSGARL